MAGSCRSCPRRSSSLELLCDGSDQAYESCDGPAGDLRAVLVGKLVNERLQSDGHEPGDDLSELVPYLLTDLFG